MNSDILKYGTGLLIFLAAFISGCKQKPAQPKQILENSLSGMESHPDGTASQRYEIDRLRAAVKKMDAARNGEPREPIIVSGRLADGFGPTRKGISLAIRIVDPTHRAGGIYILDSDRNTIEFPNALNWTKDDEFAARTVGILAFAFPVQFDDQSKTAWNSISGSDRFVIHIPPEKLKNSAEIGLITKNGKRTGTVSIFNETKTDGH